MSVTIFFCYAHEDETLLNKLKAHLRPLQRQGLIDVWSDRNISAGKEWEQEINQHLNTAQIVLLLVSPDFMDSDYCYSIEMKRALERHTRGEATVIPIILRSVYWQVGPLGKLQALPTDGKPVTNPEWYNEDRAFYDVTQGVYKVVEQLTFPPASALPPVAEGTQQRPALVGDVPPPVQQGINGAYSSTLLVVEKLSLFRTLTGHKGNFWLGASIKVALSPDGTTLVSGSSDKTIKVWELSTGKELRTLTGHTESVWSVVLSPDGQIIVSGSSDKTIKVWELSTGRELRTLTGHTESVECVALSPDGQIIVSGSRDKTIKVWELSTGRELRTLTGYIEIYGITSVALSPDGHTLVSGSWDKTIKVWELSTGRELHTLTGHTKVVRCVAISPDGQIIISGSDDKTIKMWEMSTGRELHTLTGHTVSVSSVAISSDGHTLVSGGSDKMIKVWKA